MTIEQQSNHRQNKDNKRLSNYVRNQKRRKYENICPLACWRKEGYWSGRRTKRKERGRGDVADLDDVREAGALVRVQRLVHPVGQPRRQHPHLPMVPPGRLFLSLCFRLFVPIVPLRHNEDPTIVRDPL